jgi:predicted transcriptional regulator
VADIQTKEILRQLIEELPDDCTIADVQYRLHVIETVRRGRADVAAGRVVPHGEVVRQLGEKWGRSRAK